MFGFFHFFKLRGQNGISKAVRKKLKLDTYAMAVGPDLTWNSSTPRALHLSC